MRKILLLAVAALTIVFAGCKKEDELVRKVVIADQTYSFSGDYYGSFDSQKNVYFFSLGLLEIPNVYVCGFDESLIGKTLSLAQSSSSQYYMFSLNGYHEISSDLFVLGSDLFCHNENGDFRTAFKSGTMKVTEMGDKIVVDVEGTLLKENIHFEYHSYFEKSSITTY